ncbi:MAG TPA: polysaccharide pyruvyl transferase family protein [Pyrinomonadaceae bacterium]|nr:polysaccharide pyruvyl transferase family protein [Pyrinomonadaceae bacterium]
MRIHHFYPKTRNVGDHFVQRGIERMIREVVPGASFDLFNVNSRGEDATGYGLTHETVARANREADLVVVGGSNLYEGSLRWPWGVHLEPGALDELCVPLFLMGLGTGSDFLSRPHRPSARARREILLLNGRASLSGARDVLTFDWLRRLGVSGAELTGDPATFIFNRPARRAGAGGHVLIVTPPRRFWSGGSRFWRLRLRGRVMFRALAALARSLADGGHEVVVACNDPSDLGLATKLFGGVLPGTVVCPRGPDEYFRLLSASRAVVTGRLHTAVVAFSLGVPFVLLDADQRTHGFVETYQLGEWSPAPSGRDIEARLRGLTGRLLSGGAAEEWERLVRKRDAMYERGMGLLRGALGRLG